MSGKSDLETAIDAAGRVYAKGYAQGLEDAAKACEAKDERIAKLESAFSGMKKEEKITRSQRDRWYQSAGERQDDLNKANARIAELEKFVTAYDALMDIYIAPSDSYEMLALVQARANVTLEQSE